MVEHASATQVSNYHILRSVVFGVLVAVLAWELVLSPTLGWWQARQAPAQPVVQQQPVASSTDLAVESLPVQLDIPAIGVSTSFTSPLGVNEDTGEIEVPDDFDKVGWYKYSPAPGQIGPMIILGHVDTVAGPAVFYSIGQLQEGDDIKLTGDDGVERTYKVQYTAKYEQEDFPAQKVYGDTEGPELRLITCSGIFDKQNQRYSHNRVVYATLAPEETVE